MKKEVKGLTMTVTFNEDDVADMVKKLVEEGKLAPVVHARWIDLDHGFQMCSECGERCIEDRDDLPFKAYGFCPYCGAKMDGKEEETNG